MTAHFLELRPQQLRWRCHPSALGFETTDEIDPATSVVSQAAACEALRFGLECDAPGQTVYVRDMRGTGRMTLGHRLLQDLAPVLRAKADHC